MKDGNSAIRNRGYRPKFPAAQRLFRQSMRVFGVVFFVLGMSWASAAGLPFEKASVAFMQKHCVSCHGKEKQKGDLVLHEFLDGQSLLKARKKWKGILNAVEQHEMPPDDEPQPTDEERRVFLESARAVFADADKNAKPDPGRVTLRRLNRVEYNNTIRDLMGIDVKPASDFPSDDVGHGFDNIGDVLSVSPILMERYLEAAASVANTAIPDTLPPVSKRYMAGRFTEPGAVSVPMRGEWRMMTPGKDHVGTGPLNTPFNPVEGSDYNFRTKVYAESPSGRPVRMAMLVAGPELEKPEKEKAARLEVEKVGQVANFRVLKEFEVTARDEKSAQSVVVSMPFIKGVERVALAMVRDTEANPPATVLVKYIEIEGPLDRSTPFMRKWMSGVVSKTPPEQIREVMTFFMSRAWRRPVQKDEVERVAAVGDAAMAKGALLHGAIREAVISVLSSPKFIFRMEPDDAPENPDAHPLNEFQLATRLSYFIWSTMPDDELFKLAAERKLTANLDAQVKRMLKDPKAEALVENFGLQWLQLRRLATHDADENVFKRWRPSLKNSMLEETRLFLNEIVREDRSILDMLDGDFTYIDRRLSDIYGIYPPGGFRGDDFRRVSLAGTPRGGLLTQGSILTVTSNPTRTSPVKRGKWVLEQILGEPPPPAPPNVPSIEDGSRKELSGTFRQKMMQHRADPKCGNCHAKMDTFGFSLENFDGIGRWREKDEQGKPLEIGDKAPGLEIRSLVELKKILKDQRVKFGRCVAEKMLIYAAGRGLEFYDDKAIDGIVASLSKENWKFSALVAAIAKSEPFRLRRGKSQ
jgi:hypothetical protein